MPELFKVVTVVVVGLMVGVELSVAVFVNPIFDRLPNSGGIAARSDGARVLGRVMPWWYITSVILGAVWTAQVWGRPQAWLVGGAGALLALSVAMSVLLLVPINAQVARWSAEGVPADWQRQIGRWDGLHYLRVGIIVIAFILLALAGTQSGA